MTKKIPGYLGGTPTEVHEFTFYIKNFFKRIKIFLK
tara:strand:+ start:63 stop:170 length:108 start_codon:yes stop_codon:yes gene_type:complete